MNIDQLKTLVTIIDTGSFRKASTVLHKAQSAVSVSVKNLENWLGFSLFDRTKYRPSLTTEGKAFYEKARHMVKRFESLEEFSKSISKGVESEVCIAVSFIAQIDHLPEILRSFSDEFPRTNVSLYIGAMRKPFDMLYSQQADFAICPMTDPEDEIESSHWPSTKIVPVLGSKHPFSKKLNSLTEDDLRDSPQIIVSSTKDPSDGISAGILSGGKHWSVSDFSTKKYLLGKGLGWGGMPYHLIHKELKDESFFSIDHIRRSSQIPMGVARSRESHEGPAKKKLWNLLTAKK